VHYCSIRVETGKSEKSCPHDLENVVAWGIMARRQEKCPLRVVLAHLQNVMGTATALHADSSILRADWLDRSQKNT